MYPQDAFLGEESADALRQNEQLAGHVWELVLRAKEETRAIKSENGDAQNVRDVNELAFPKSKEEMCDLIDLGGKGEVTGRGRVWVMDPVDGTATFMRQVPTANTTKTTTNMLIVRTSNENLWTMSLIFLSIVLRFVLTA